MDSSHLKVDQPAFVKSEYKYSELTGRIIGCAMEVHKELGNGFQACLPKGSTARRQEVVYQRAMAYEMALQRISFEREFEMPIFYKGEFMATRRVDFFVEKNIALELKATTKLDDTNLAQAINYLEAYNLEIGLLINFGARKLEFHRLINKKFRLIET